MGVRKSVAEAAGGEMFQLSRRSFASRDVGSVGRRGSAAVSLPEMLSGWVGGGDTQIEALGKKLSEIL